MITRSLKLRMELETKFNRKNQIIKNIKNYLSQHAENSHDGCVRNDEVKFIINIQQHEQNNAKLLQRRKKEKESRVVESSTDSLWSWT